MRPLLSVCQRVCRGGREDFGDEGRAEIEWALLQDIVDEPLEEGVSEVLDGRQEKGLLRPLGYEEGDELGLGPDVLEELEDGLAGRALGADDVDRVAVDEAVAEEADPVALADLPGRTDLGYLVIESVPVSNLL